ncbi:hypothetical protein HMPREF2674_08710 [Rothia sp. HMSC062F03]|nr:hypothetical protein HMPREF2630_07785 [Rothia sp. HMSC072B03]OHP75370.1 hypothetical protein HMPREF2674_08710 [Rothia sp. HMSC062F03]
MGGIKALTVVITLCRVQNYYWSLATKSGVCINCCTMEWCKDNDDTMVLHGADNMLDRLIS